MAGMISNALLSLLPQVGAMLLLAPADFGEFSLVYLVFALLGSVCLSTISEPWALRARDVGRNDGDQDSRYVRVLGSLSMTGALVAGVVAATTVKSLVDTLLLAIAVGAAVVRSGLRYREVSVGDFRRALAADSLGILGFLVTIGAMWYVDWINVAAVASAWSLGCLCSMIVSPTIGIASISTLRSWWTHHSFDAKRLLRDSALGDLSAIGTPYILALLLPLGAFGVYRGVSNVSAPVRLVLAPIRPILGRMAPAKLVGTRLMFMVLALGAVAGLVATIVLKAVASRGVLGEVLHELSQYAVPTGLFILGNTVVHFYATIGRLCLSPRSLLVSRLGQVTLSILGPGVGALIAGLGGAIVGLGGATLVAGALWAISVRALGGSATSKKHVRR